jgi:acetyl coenzyme A synthetase (ADP forming)-like protein
MRSILAPRSIAVIGASRTERTMGNQVMRNLVQQGFAGPVYPVNPKARSVCSVRAYPHLSDIPDPVDLAVIVVPRDIVSGVVEECAGRGVKGLVVISAGFREIGEEGAARERRLLEIVRQHGMRMVGPNCMGVINAHPEVLMNATFAPYMPPFGHSAFVSQSGALGLSVIDYAREYGIGISQFVSVGNKADVSGNDLLEAWEHDPTVKVILMYVENFGNPAKFLEIARRITAKKPIIAVKSGRTKAGSQAAVSHTGALAASDAAVDALLTQAGVLRADTIEALFDMAMAFGAQAMPRGRRVAVVSNAGGPGILAADAMEGHGLEMVTPGAAAVSEIAPLLPKGVAVRNPLDLIASATPAGYRQAIGSLLRDPTIDAVVPIFIPPLGVDQDAVASAIVESAAAVPDKPVLAVMMGRQGLPEWRAQLHRAGIPTYIFPESAARALAALSRHREAAAEPRESAAPLQVDHARAAAVIANARREGRDRLTTAQSLDIIEAYGVPVTPARFAATKEAAVQAACAIGFPVVMKVESRDIAHKSDVGGVVLRIANEADAVRAYDDIMSAVASKQPGARIEGVLIARQEPAARETIVGVARDPLFGPVVMFGLGGIYAEILRDVVFRIAPLTPGDARAMTAGIRGKALLGGVRGQPAVELSALHEVIRRVAQLAMEHPGIAEIDVNPLLVSERGVVAADCRVVLAASHDAAFTR